jgi:hypothetical protein
VESALKKRVERNMFKVSKDFQNLKFSINKKLREIGAEIPPEDGVPGDLESSQYASAQKKRGIFRSATKKRN